MGPGGLALAQIYENIPEEERNAFAPTATLGPQDCVTGTVAYPSDERANRSANSVTDTEGLYAPTA